MAKRINYRLDGPELYISNIHSATLSRWFGRIRVSIHDSHVWSVVDTVEQAAKFCIARKKVKG